MVVSMLAIGSDIDTGRPPYQDALRTPGISPRTAIMRKQIRQMPNLRYTARERPQN